MCVSAIQNDITTPSRVCAGLADAALSFMCVCLCLFVCVWGWVGAVKASVLGGGWARVTAQAPCVSQ